MDKAAHWPAQREAHAPQERRGTCSYFIARKPTYNPQFTEGIAVHREAQELSAVAKAYGAQRDHANSQRWSSVPDAGTYAFAERALSTPTQKPVALIGNT